MYSRPPSAPGRVNEPAPAPGELKIRERRSWRTWQLLVFVAGALVVGMAIGNSGGSNAAPVAKSYTLPAPAGSPASPSTSAALAAGVSTTTQVSAGGTATAGSSSTLVTTTVAGTTGAAVVPATSAPSQSGTHMTTTTASTGGAVVTSLAERNGNYSVGTAPPTSASAAGSSLAPTSAPSTTTPSATAGPPGGVLVPRTQAGGSWSTHSFTVSSGGWQVGWAYQCGGVRAGPAFQIYVLSAGSAAAPQPLVQQYTLANQGVTAGTVHGTITLQVEANETCVSAVKVIATA
jgi:hypothetical protein